MEDIENDPEPNLRELLRWKRKRNKAPTAKSNSLPCCVKVKTPDGRIIYKLRRCTRPTCSMQGGPGGRLKHRSLICCMAQEDAKEENDKEVEEKTVTREETQATAEEKLEKVNLSTEPIPRLNPSLVMHMLNVEPRTKPVAQLAKVFHTQSGCPISCPYQMICRFQKSQPSLPRRQISPTKYELVDRFYC